MGLLVALLRHSRDYTCWRGPYRQERSDTVGHGEVELECLLKQLSSREHAAPPMPGTGQYVVSHTVSRTNAAMMPSEQPLSHHSTWRHQCPQPQPLRATGVLGVK